jgi:hypothetical protein
MMQISAPTVVYAKCLAASSVCGEVIMNVQAMSNSSAAAICRNGPLLRKISVVRGRTERILLGSFSS